MNRSRLARLLRGFFVAALTLLTGIAHAGPQTQAGPYHLELTTDPGVIPVGKAKLQIKITDAAGKPVEGVTLRALTKMPSMDMGEREQPGSMRAGEPGVYDVPAQFAMEGGYESTLRITGPLGEATAHISLATGQNTMASGSGDGSNGSILPYLLWGGAALVALFWIFNRMRRTGQPVNWKGVFNGQVLGGLILLALITAGAVYAVTHFRRAGALTPIEAQAMDMSYLPPPPGFQPVELTTATRGPIESHVRYSGTAVGFVEQDVSPRITGVLVAMPLYAGDRVTKGQIIARLDTSQSQPLLAQQEAAAGMARQGVSVAQAERRQAEAEVEQAHSELSGKQGALAEAKAQIDAAREERANADAALTSAQAKIVDAQAELTAMQADQIYWRAQIARSATLREAGAISGEEFQKDKAQADTAEAKTRQAEARLVQAKADVQGAQSSRRKEDAGIVAANARIQIAQSELTAHLAHVRSAGAAVSVATQKIAQARSGAIQAEAGAQAATAMKGYSEIRAEADGVVTQRLISPGVLVNPGQVLLKIAQIDPIRLQANVAEADFARIRVGSAVQIRGRDADGKPLTARITSIAPAADPVARTGIVEAIVPNPDKRFVPGQYVVMDVTTGAAREGVRVPARAIQYRTPNNAGEGVLTTQTQPYLWLAEAVMGQDGQYTVRRVDVTLGVRGDALTEIVSGLSDKQRIVLSGATYLKDGDLVAQIPHNDGRSGTMAMDAPPSDATVQTRVQTAAVAVTDRGYEPAQVNVKVGVPVRIAFTRTSDKTCGTEVTFPDYALTKKLPLNQPVVIEFTPKKAGEIAFACGMNMLHGKAVAR